jgi:hypothetical protein
MCKKIKVVDNGAQYTVEVSIRQPDKTYIRKVIGEHLPFADAMNLLNKSNCSGGISRE